LSRTWSMPNVVVAWASQSRQTLARFMRCRSVRWALQVCTMGNYHERLREAGILAATLDNLPILSRDLCLDCGAVGAVKVLMVFAPH
jgi:hypothetical protein